jgi:Tfp pilus assembly protein PilN
VIKDCLYTRKIPLAIISQLQKAIPQEIAINMLGLDEKDAITLRGQAFQLSDVFKFVTSLEKAGVFKDIQTKYTRKRKLKDREITDFELSFQLAS